MLKINNAEYSVLERFIDFDPFEANVDGVKRKGNALNITLITNDFKLSIETVYDYEWIKELKIDEEKDISNYIVSITHESKKDSMILTDKCECTLKRKDANLFNIQLKGKFNDIDEQLDIEYNETIEI